MIQILNEADSLIIVIHEIYGINQHMTSFCERLSEQGFDVICPNLLKREQPFDYSEEEIAYQNFIENVGFTEAVHKIKNVLVSIKLEYKKIYIIGFSIGATVAWLCSEEDYLDGIVGYYGSRIRNYKELVPARPTILFFPQKERFFDVNELISNLDKRNTEIHEFNGEHGFSDPYSPNFNAKSASDAFDEMLNFIRRH
ncbi:dienelactone hydrolase family protein [Gracilibacillus caseinilyticus]|uniref:Dienelactone hydrolase family protein n=1 Tax=Gracilibacillus caseinilyticus TaxID=2932256 RepID=A0ABY4F2E7_9BACI|nr:dienelactone hydrolase family protein [Gracilibacillus caseinilyticus]UOQ50390.1 dienelactone hydrolase family protein [Gracilibacillus caseinilyticus]